MADRSRHILACAWGYCHARVLSHRFLVGSPGVCRCSLPPIATLAKIARLAHPTMRGIVWVTVRQTEFRTNGGSRATVRGMVVAMLPTLNLFPHPGVKR